MKLKLTMLAVLIVCFAGKISANVCKTEVPQAVLDAFKAKYPTATDVEWEKDGDNEYEAEFEIGKNEYETSFTATGQWLETEMEIEESELPTAVLAAFKAKYPAAKKIEIAKVETPAKGTLYEFEFKDGKEKKEVLYNADGTPIPDDDDDEKDEDE